MSWESLLSEFENVPGGKEEAERLKAVADGKPLKAALSAYQRNMEEAREHAKPFFDLLQQKPVNAAELVNTVGTLAVYGVESMFISAPASALEATISAVKNRGKKE